MNKKMDFYFDFSSPYAYFAAFLVDEFGLKHGLDIDWHGYLLGAVFKKYGGAPLVSHPLKAPYARQDLQRCSDYYNIPFHLPDPFPVTTIHAVRAFYHIKEEQGNKLASDFAKAVFYAYFVENKNISDLQMVVDLACAFGHDAETYKNNIMCNILKDKVRKINDDNLEKGIFGTPYFIIDGDSFWGVDRLPMISHWLNHKS